MNSHLWEKGKFSLEGREGGRECCLISLYNTNPTYISLWAKFIKSLTIFLIFSDPLVHPEPHKHQHKARKTQTKAKKRKSKGVEELSIVRTILKDGEDEERSEISHKDAFSEEDLTEFMENSTMEDSDFRLLRHQPLNVQLEKLFGEKAESYLNPTLEESPRKIPNGALVKKSMLN